MDWTPEQLAKARALLAEDSAILVQKQTVAYAAGARDAAGRRRQKIVRQWPKISDGDRALCDAYLREYASADNDAPGRIVHGPQADRETYAGDWRMTRTDLSRLKTDPREQGVYQTLVFPADASDGPDGAFPSEETHLNHVHSVVSTGDAPAELDCAVPPPRTRLSVNARLDRETGEWESEKRTDTARHKRWDYSDGDALATTKHVREEHADAPPAVPAPTPGKSFRANADIDEYGTFRTQVDETTAHQKTTGPYTASQNALQSTTEESVRNAQKAPSAGDNEAVSAHINEFGLVDFNKRKTTPKPAEAQAEAAEWTEKTTSLAYQNADAEKSSIPGVADAHAIVPGATAHRNEFGKVDGSVTVTVPIERQSGPHVVEQTALRKVESTFHFNKASVPPATSSGGTVTTYNPRVNRFGLIDLEERKTSPGTLGTNAWKRIYPAEWWTETVCTMEFRNWTDVPKKENFGRHDALAAYGVLSNHNVTLNGLDLFDGYLVLTIPVAQKGPEVVIEDSEQRQITAQAFFNQKSQPPASTSAPGSVTTYSARQNRFGLWDYEKRTVAFKPKDGVEYTSEATDQHTTKVQQKFNQPAPEQSQAAPGTVQTVHNRVNEAGSYDTEKRTTTYNAVDAGKYTSEDGFFEKTTTQQKFNQTAPLEAKRSTGDIQTVHNRLNEAGRYDIETRTEKAEKRSSAAVVVENTPERKVTLQHFYNQPSPPQSATHSNGVSTIYSGMQLNRFGFYDYLKQVVEDKGGFGNGYSYTYHTPYQPAIKEWKKISSSKGKEYKIVKWSKKRLAVTVNVVKHTSISAAQGALSGQENVRDAHITQGGTGIWYSHLTTVKEEWQD